MKTFKSAFYSLLVLAATLFSTQVFAGDIVVPQSNQVRSALTKMIQNPNLKDNGISEAELFLQFKIDEKGEIILMNINTDSDYLVAFAKEKLHHQKIDLVDVPPNTVYNLKVKFELK